jgi:uncharacterized OsmC-like protein
MGKDPDPADLLTVSVAAALLGCSVDLVRYYADTNRLPVQVTTTRVRLFKRGDVEAFRVQWERNPYRRPRPHAA